MHPHSDTHATGIAPDTMRSRLTVRDILVNGDTAYYTTVTVSRKHCPQLDSEASDDSV